VGIDADVPAIVEVKNHPALVILPLNHPPQAMHW
jgi:hypothetical protein